MSKIYVLVGHPDSESMLASWADTYVEGARSNGHEVKIAKIGDMKFDPILHKGYKAIQELEQDLKQVQEDIKWCEHFVLFYPVWWAGMPGMLKGFFDRVWLPGFAFRFKKEGLFKDYIWQRLMKGKSAQVIVTMDNYPAIARILFGDITNEIHFGILRFSGFWPVKVMKIGGIKFMSQEKKDAWKERMRMWGRKAK